MASKDCPNPGGNLSFVLHKNNLVMQILKEDFLFFMVCMNRKGKQWEKKQEEADVKKKKPH